MLLVLAILCGLMILFAGGCAVFAVSLGMLPLAVIPGGIAVLNLLVLLAVRRRQAPSYPAFAALAALDLAVAALILCSLAVSFATPHTDQPQVRDPLVLGAIALAGGLLLKGVLTVIAALRLRAAGPAAEAGHDGSRQDRDG